ncbi:MAG: class I SAM-dependent methyltransferase, partial [Oscillospiraceae bacterium]|nr:class I SAM-dependent methyltransferase [Oscillospiraceae bacterium]
MTIEEQFNLIAQKYDINRRKFIPCFEEFYEKTTDFLAACAPAPKRILDLGAGTGLLSHYWYKHFPEAGFTLTDIAEDMLKIARERFDGAENVRYSLSDYSEGLPE